MVVIGFTGLELAGAFFAGGIVAAGFIRLLDLRLLKNIQKQANRSLEEAEAKSERILLQAEEEVSRLRQKAEQNVIAEKTALASKETTLSNRETILNRQLDELVQQEAATRESQNHAEELIESLRLEEKELHAKRKELSESLEACSRLTAGQAREMILAEAKARTAQTAQELEHRTLAEARAKAESQAKKIISIAIQRYAGEHAFESTTATVALNGDDIKGRIIGREGRNIRAFESATGVTVLIDDTPNAVVISGFDPVRREIARESMRRLIAEGRIHPTRIEEIVDRVTEEIGETLYKSAEDAVVTLNLPALHPEVLKVLGKLRFRHSYSQNVLDHSIEVAEITGLLASELNLDVTMAKRTGLLHDIGKALGHELDGPHAIVGGQFLKQYNEPQEVVDGVSSHHGETKEITIFGALSGAADAISAARPGARSETVTAYLKRLQNLEDIGLSFAGVEKCFAVHAGRELRVMVRPERINDEGAQELAKKLSRRIEDEMLYPGQVKVTVLRETRCIEVAK